MICKLCNKRKAEQAHHIFSNTKLNRKFYKDFLNHKDNLLPLCSTCHLNKPIPKWNEIEFCKHFKIIPRTKTGRRIWDRMAI